MIGKGKKSVKEVKIARQIIYIYSQREGNYKSYAYFFCKKENFCLVKTYLIHSLLPHTSLTLSLFLSLSRSLIIQTTLHPILFLVLYYLLDIFLILFHLPFKYFLTTMTYNNLRCHVNKVDNISILSKPMLKLIQDYKNTSGKFSFDTVR